LCCPSKGKNNGTKTMTAKDQETVLTIEQVDNIKVWLREKVVNPCEACGDSNWLINERIVAPMNFSANGALSGGKVLPHFCVICKNCGNTRFFNAVLTGILKKEQKDSNG
jgi:predicted nucleic-acid-binding Zn-ribbon protein